MAQATYNLMDLKNVQECTIQQTLQGEYTGNIKGIYADLSKVNSRDFIVIDGQTFMVMKPKKTGGDCKLYWESELWHISYTLIEDEQEGIEVYGATYESIINTILPNTSFTCTSCESGTCDFKYEPSGGIGNKREALMQLINDNELEIKFDNMSFVVSKQIGANSSYTFVYRKDIKSINVTEDASKQITRIIPVNSNGVTIADVNNGSIYLDSDNVGNYSKPITYVLVVNADTDDPDKITEMKNFIKTEGQKYLDKYKYGYIEFEIDVINYSATYEGGHSPLLSYNIGDGVAVSYSPLGVNIGLRISELEYDALKKRNVTVKLENVIYRGKVGEYESYLNVLADNIVGVIPIDNIPLEDIGEDITNNLDMQKIVESILNSDILNSQIVNAQNVNTEVLNADEVYADYAEIGDATIKRLTVDELKTMGSDNFTAATNNYFHAYRQYLQWITGTKSGTEQAKDYKDRNLYYADGTSGGFTLTTKKPSMPSGGTNADLKYILAFCYAHETETDRIPNWIQANGKNYLVWGKDVANVTNADKTIDKTKVQFTGNLDILFPTGVQKTVATSPIKLDDGDHDIYVATMLNLTPVMQNKYTELIKAQMFFKDMGSGNMIPVMQMGAGNGTGDKGKTFLYKAEDGFHIEYHAITNAKIYSFLIDDSGMHLKQDDGTGTITDMPIDGGGKPIKTATITSTGMTVEDATSLKTQFKFFYDDSGNISSINELAENGDYLGTIYIS